MAEVLGPLTYGQVTGRFLTGGSDTASDTDAYPDSVPCGGTITFTPSPEELIAPNGTPVPFQLLPAPITGVLDSQGYLCQQLADGTAGARGVYLYATDNPAVTPAGWTYRVGFELNAGGGSPIQRSSYPGLSVPGGRITDLSQAAPIASSNGVVITKGDKGDTGAGMNFKGSVTNYAALPKTGVAINDAYKASDTGYVWIWTVTGWVSGGTLTGPANSLSIGTVTSGAAGSAAAASVTGTPPAQTLNLTIPAGATGGQGQPGAPGPVPIVAYNPSTGWGTIPSYPCLFVSANDPSAPDPGGADGSFWFGQEP